jgi:hypothetical protein
MSISAAPPTATTTSFDRRQIDTLGGAMLDFFVVAIDAQIVNVILGSIAAISLVLRPPAAHHPVKGRQIMQTVTLNDGVKMPIVGFGVFQIPEDQTQATVEAALKAGYRHLDTAASYGNEDAVGGPSPPAASRARTSSSPPSSGSSTPRRAASRTTPSAPSTTRCADSDSTTSICT